MWTYIFDYTYNFKKIKDLSVKNVILIMLDAYDQKNKIIKQCDAKTNEVLW
jgi:hypothetical protein